MADSFDSSHTSELTPLYGGAALALDASRFVQRAAAAVCGLQSDDAERLRYLVNLAAHPWTAERLQQQLAQFLSAAPPSEDPAAALASALRRLRRACVLGLIVRDCAQVAPLAEIVHSMTALAELAVQRVVAMHGTELAQLHGVPLSRSGLAQDLLVVAMGKAGSAELNVSSDLDLVLVYDEEGETAPYANVQPRRGGLSNHEFFERLGRRVSSALSEVTADGFVFRIDLRLRPHGDAGPLAVSHAMLEEYLLREGREWERFAWAKGRVISLPVYASSAQFETQCQALQSLVTPFVFRKYLDFNAAVALREVHAMIRAETQRRSHSRRGGHAQHEDNVKLGRGGIREIEFIAQTFQIVRGGREQRLRQRGTLATLATLGELGLLETEVCTQLAQAYEFLRRLEHALQYLDDAQTHLLPTQDDELERVAKLLKIADAASLRHQWQQTREFVAGVFDRVFLGDGGNQGDNAAAASERPDEDGWVQRLTEAHFQDAARMAARLISLLASRRVSASSETARLAIDKLLLQAVSGIATVLQGEDHPEGADALRSAGVTPDEVLTRFIQLIEAICGRSTYLTLLAQYPRAFKRVLRLLAGSRWATDYLCRHPILLDELLDERLLLREPDWSAWSADIEAQLTLRFERFDAPNFDAELAMNLLRDAHHAQLFRLLVADLEGRLTVERLADHLSALADATLALVLSCVWQTLPKRHRDLPAFAVIGYGKLGGKELGYASDLDLIFLYDDEHPDAAEIYALLVRRLMTWLTSQTSSGILFEIDLRLRPNGNAGLLVSSFAAFARYQRNEDGLGAWTWEHQALTRARFCAGDVQVGAQFERLREEILQRPRDRAALLLEVQAMRQKMLDGHPNKTAQFDLKHDRGGMVDVEFIVQTLVLAYAQQHAALLRNAGNLALLGVAAELKLIDSALSQQVAAAYRHMRVLQHRLRLNGSTYARIEPSVVASEAESVRRLWQQVFAVGIECS